MDNLGYCGFYLRDRDEIPYPVGNVDWTITMVELLLLSDVWIKS